MRLTFRGEYPPDWPELEERVRQEAGNRCIRCGHPRGDRMRLATAGERWGTGAEMVKELVPCGEFCTHPRNGRMRVLTVHHLDGDKANSLWWNLLALCQVCHLEVQCKLVPERPYLWEHKEWFRPFVCGFYAAYYGGVVITRAQADAEPERWLALGQPWLYQARG